MNQIRPNRLFHPNYREPERQIRLRLCLTTFFNRGGGIQEEPLIDHEFIFIIQYNPVMVFYN
jgi:hypothetical protein